MKNIFDRKRLLPRYGLFAPRGIMLAVFLIALVVLTFGTVKTSHATHYRYWHYNWKPVSGNTIEFSLPSAFRRNGYMCYDPATLTSVACSEPDGRPGVGDVIVEYIGSTRFNFGDGTDAGSPLYPLMYLVTSIDPANNWLFGEALDPASLPTIDTTITHTYPTTGDYLAYVNSCCRISSTLYPNSHINNPDGMYRAETIVNVGTGNRPPTSNLPPIVLCPIGELCEIPVPVNDPDGDEFTCRLSSSSEAGYGFTQPGPPNAPNAADIGSDCIYRWDTTGATLGPSGYNTLYSTQVTVEDLDSLSNAKSKVALDFFIQLIECPPEGCEPPEVVPPPGEPPVCNATIPMEVGGNIIFTVEGSDPNPGDSVTLNVAGLPFGATMTPSLPVSGNPVSSEFSWIPTISQTGSHVINFNAASPDGIAFCPVTVEVDVEVIEGPPDDPTCSDGFDNDNDGFTDADDSDCAETGLSIDIKPQSCPNPINVNSQGVLPVAILGTTDFDVSQIDPESVLLEGVIPLHYSVEDVATPFTSSEVKEQATDCTEDGPDGIADLTFKFDIQDIAAVLNPATDGEVWLLQLTAVMLDGTPVEGNDVIIIRNK